MIQVEEFEEFLRGGNYEPGIVSDSSMLSQEKVQKVHDVMATQFESYVEVSTAMFALMIKEKCTGKFELSDSEVNVLISLIDENGDGVVQVEEFEHFLQHHARIEDGLVLDGAC
mmetsp:Transcript_43517/g.59433  ORF Transcript_43517/g.59433 Transcript_43517/m.59433 type:complete len:114 (-) Transcript_43517:134-475(-)